MKNGMSSLDTPSARDRAAEHGQTLGSAPTVDVIVPAYNEEAHLDRCLDGVLAQDYPGERITVWIIDAGSSDRTLAIAEARSAADPRVRVLSGIGRLSTPEALNAGIAAGSAELVARIDAHWHPDADYLKRAVEAFQALPADTACVGGPPKQIGETGFGWALAAARTSRFGVGGTPCYSLTPRRERVYTLQGGVYRRAALDETSLFDPAMVYGEDEELNWRLGRGGWKIFLDSALGVEYVTRSSWSAAFRQYRNYGDARVRVIAAHPGFLRAHHLVPAALVSAIGILGVASLRSRRARGILAAASTAYALAGVAAASVTERDERASVLRVATAFSALHLGYGVGELRSLVRLALRSTGAGRQAGDVFSEMVR
jgi:cellulose synthase/poly-beta-1,6-N-acetylglucosamine synthase-like glycosyltransferase